MSEHDQIMAALFTQQRLQILAPDTSYMISNVSYLYAWTVGLYPADDDSQIEGFVRPHEHYSKHFMISREKVNEVLNYLDQCWVSGQIPTFEEIELRYKAQEITSEWRKADLLHICRYIFLSEIFDEAFWNTVLSPKQCQGDAMFIRAEFCNENIILV